MTARRVNQAQLARICGVSRPTINKLVAKGVVKLDDDGLCDPQEAVNAIAAHADPSHAASRDTVAARIAAGTIRLTPTPAIPELAAAAGPAEPSDAPAPQPRDPAMAATPAADPGAEITSFQLARALREKFAALNEQLEYETRRGELIPRDVVERTVFGLARAAQEALRAIPDRLAPMLAAESDPHVVHQLLDRELRIVIQQIAAAQPVPPPPTSTPAAEAAAA